MINYPRVIKDKIYPEMYRIEWEKGDVSDMVNITRAKDAVRCKLEYDRRFANNNPEEGSRSLAGEFK